MKTKLFTTLLFIFSTIVFVKAQTSINIYTVDVSSSGSSSGITVYCDPPKLLDFYMYGVGNNYVDGDIFTIKADFGDGTDTTFTTTVNGSWFTAPFKHWYNSTGSFLSEVVAIGPDLKTDTFKLKDPIILESPCQSRVLLGSQDSLYYYYDKCEVPQKVYLYVNGSTMMYNPGSDSITLKMSFGDGNDTIFKSPLFNAGTNYQNFNAQFSHNFNSKGNYSLEIIGIGPDGKSDTLIKMNAFLLKDTCGNVSGRVYEDMNGDCLYNSAEPVMKYVSVALMENADIIAWTNTNSKGEYWFDVPAPGNYSVKLYYGYYYYGVADVCPSSGAYSITTLPSLNNDFGFDCSNGFDLTTELGGWRFRPGFTGYLYLYPQNEMCQPTAGTVKMLLDPQLTFKNSYPQTPTISGDTLIFNYTSLSSVTWWNNLEYLEVETSTSAQIGDTVCVTVIITPEAGDTDPSNNVKTYCFPVRNSWDPNMKEVHAEGMDENGTVAPNKTLIYTVHFQNMGTDTAYNISVLDTLDANLRMETFKILGSSHDVEPVILDTRVLKFNFNNIMLPDDKVNEPASHGSVTYSIEQKQNLPLGTQVKNTAHIFFDFNPAIITNTVITNININASSILNKKKPVSLYPNPACNIVGVNFNTVQTGRSIKLVDILGNEVLNKKSEGLSESLDLSLLPAGIYLMLINSEPSFKEKIIKIK